MSTQGLPSYGLTVTNRVAAEIAREFVPNTDMNPPYQRGSVWIEDQRMALVKSWVMGIPVPAIILNDRSTRGWIDANDGELSVPANWWPSTDIESTNTTKAGEFVTFTDLTLAAQRHMKRGAMLPLVEAKLPTVQSEAELYVLVNGGGTAQTESDIEKAARAAEGN